MPGKLEHAGKHMDGWGAPVFSVVLFQVLRRGTEKKKAKCLLLRRYWSLG